MTTLRSLVLIAALSLLVLAPVPAQAQTAPGQLPGIVATGFGSASEPAQSANLQFLIGSAQSFGMGGVMMEESVAVMAGTPGAEMPMEPAPVMSNQLTADHLAPVVEAMETAGADPAGIEVIVPSHNSMFGPGGPEVGEIWLAVDQPDSEQLQSLVQAAYDSAAGAGLTVLFVGASYEAADCAALTQLAREAAIADAQVRAAGLAAGLGVPLGALVQASEAPFFGSPGGGTCMPEGMEMHFGPYGPGTFPAFDPAMTSAIVSMQVTLTYAFGG